MAGVGAVMYAVAALLVGTSVLLPHDPDLNPAAILALASTGAVAAAFIWLARRWLPIWFFQISTAAGTVIVALCVYWSGDSNSPYALLLVWVAVFSAYFFTTRQLILQLGFAAIAYAAALLAHPHGQTDAAAHWLLTIPALAVAAAIIAVLVRSGRRLVTERERLLAETMELARTDPLTGLLNRRAWSELLEREMLRARRTGNPLCVALFDLDNFKQFNDERGHPEGDMFLQELAKTWEFELRPTDGLARYGGEEFALLLPDCDLADASEVVGRLRNATPYGQRCSAGLARWDGVETDPELMARTDVLLYEAKQTGRDRLVSADRGLPGPR